MGFILVLMHSPPLILGILMLRDDLKKKRGRFFSSLFILISSAPVIASFYMISDPREYGVLVFLTMTPVVVLSVLGFIILVIKVGKKEVYKSKEEKQSIDFSENGDNAPS